MNSLRAMLKKQPTAIGTAITMGSTALSECISSTGIDWIFFDMEHSPIDYGDVQQLIQAMKPGCLSFIRMREASALCVKKSLDTGCDGIIAPRVNDKATAEMIVEFAHYPPAGQRSLGISRSSGFGGYVSEAIKTDNDRISIHVQIEHADAVDVVEDIASVKGLDGLYIGPYDLSGSYGLQGEIHSPIVKDAIAKILNTAQKNDLIPGIFCGNDEDAENARDLGFKFITTNADIARLLASCQDSVKRLK